MRPLRDGLLALAGAASTALVWHGLKGQRRSSWGSAWERTNHAGNPVTLLEGVALVGGTVAAAAATGGAWPHPRLPTLVASVGAGALGALDDLRQDTDRKGLAGHLSALAHGRVTTGSIKILGLAATGLAAAGLDDALRAHAAPRGCGTPDVGRTPGTRTSRIWGTLAGGAVIAGSANLANLFDLRPGRALKVGVLTATPLVLTGPGSPSAALTLGAVAALLPQDLAGTSMLGDTGANPLGAVLGLALVQRQGPLGRTLSLGMITALTLASERISFTRVIESTPVLRELDALGRQGPEPSRSPSSAPQDNPQTGSGPEHRDGPENP